MQPRAAGPRATGGCRNTSNASGERPGWRERALHVDLDHDVVARGEVLLDRRSRRALQVAVDLEPLEEPALVAESAGTRRGDEAVVAPVDLSGRAAGGRSPTPRTRDRARVRAAAGRRALARSRRTGDDDEHAQGVVTAVSAQGRSARAGAGAGSAPSPRRRRLSLMSRSRMSRRALTLPVFGIDSSMLTTFSLPSTSSSSPRSKSSPSVSAPVLSCSLTSARMRARDRRLLERGATLRRGERRAGAASSASA